MGLRERKALGRACGQGRKVRGTWQPSRLKRHWPAAGQGAWEPERPLGCLGQAGGGGHSPTISAPDSLPVAQVAALPPPWRLRTGLAACPPPSLRESQAQPEHWQNFWGFCCHGHFWLRGSHVHSSHSQGLPRPPHQLLRHLAQRAPWPATPARFTCMHVCVSMSVCA